jgi:GTP-binding protein HflX
MFERPQGGNRAILVHVAFGRTDDQEDLLEFHELAVSAGAKPLSTVIVSRRLPEAKYLIGSGKAEEVHQQVLAMQADIVLVNHELTPAQERNLEQLCECRVIDRTRLILDIFAQRARTFEGKLQVELAQLQHLSTRLVRGWTHLERQKGGIGLRGPGETQLETDRRLIKARISMIQKRLEKVRQQRTQNRRARSQSSVPVLSLVGYTNAGKSTLFNRLTGSQGYVADKLFATLDPTLRRMYVPALGTIVLADTVGFIRHLPHDLVEAFRATLEETREANLLLHVVDAAHPARQAQIDQVEQVLTQIDAMKVPIIQIYNKIDQLENVLPHVRRDSDNNINAVWLSALTGDGIELLYAALEERLNSENLK